MRALRMLPLLLVLLGVLLPAAAQTPEVPETSQLEDTLAVKPAAPIAPAASRRRVTPVNTAATRTQHINETVNDTARINERRRARSTSFTDDKGTVVFVDTLTGEQWVDSSLIARVPRMTKPLIYSGSVGVNIWDPVMRIFGQHYGLIDAWVQLNMHNRYLPVFEMGVGQTDHRPETGNYTFHVPASVYFRLGADYNFFYNSSPDYLLLAGLRYGFSPFRYGVRDIVLDSDYWHETATFDIPLRSATAGWLELRLGVRVKIWGPISMGWYFKYSKMLHESRNPAGQPSYVPGFGTRGPGIGGSFSVIYTIPLAHLNKSRAPEVVNEDKTPES